MNIGDTNYRDKVADILEAVLNKSMTTAEAIAIVDEIPGEACKVDRILGVSIHQLGHYRVDEPLFEKKPYDKRYADRILQLCVKYLRHDGSLDDFDKEFDNVNGEE